MAASGTTRTAAAVDEMRLSFGCVDVFGLVLNALHYRVFLSDHFKSCIWSICVAVFRYVTCSICVFINDNQKKQDTLIKKTNC